MDIGDAYRKIQNKQLQKRMDERRRKEMLERMKKQAKKMNQKEMEKAISDRCNLLMAPPWG